MTNLEKKCCEKCCPDHFIAGHHMGINLDSHRCTNPSCPNCHSPAPQDSLEKAKREFFDPLVAEHIQSLTTPTPDKGWEDKSDNWQPKVSEVIERYSFRTTNKNWMINNRPELEKALRRFISQVREEAKRERDREIAEQLVEQHPDDFIPGQ